jgi:DNA-binding transcriptional LysR family regulator
MDIRQLEVFAKVAEFKSFSKAADKMGISQPTVSAHIQNLESELGVRLFDRSGRKVFLTTEGKVLLKYAKDIIRKKEEALSKVLSISENLSGDLKIAASNVPGEYFLPAILPLIRKLMPSVRLTVDVFDSRKVIKLLSEEFPEYDIGFVGSSLKSRNLEYKEVMKDELVLVAPSSYAPSVITLDDFIKMPLILREEGSGTRISLEQMLKSMGIDVLDLNVVAILGNNTAVKEAVIKGSGFGVVSKYSIRNELKCKLLKKVAIKDIKIERKFFAVRRKDLTPSPSARRLWDNLSYLMKGFKA